MLFVAALAALLASFPARNSDLWMHLASGRRLAGGDSPSGAALHAASGLRDGQGWLYDLLCYSLYSVFGGAGLVFCKTLLVVGLALVLLRLSRVGQGWGVAAACTALALLTMSPRLLLQPAVVSFLFLALTLWIGRPREAPPEKLARVVPPWPLLLLFVVWVNVDGWFVLGLGTAALVWLGRTLDLARQEEVATGSNGVRKGWALLVSSARWLFVSVAVLAVACLCNPSHVKAFALLLDQVQVASPFRAPYLAALVRAPGGLAYFALLALGLLSFVANRSRWSWERFLPWLGVALLSAFWVRAIPFFAVVAGPVLARNLQESRERRAKSREPEASGSRLSTLGSWLLTAGAVGCLICAWPGWLRGPPFEPPRWDVEVPPSLERGAATTRRWHREGRLAAHKRGLHLSPETAYAFAWLCPEENGVLDRRLTARLLGGSREDWTEGLRAADIDHVIVWAPGRERPLRALGGMLKDPQEWPLLYREGDLAVFGWRDGATKGHASQAASRGAVDLNRLAFRPADADKAPRKGPGRDPEPRHWWDAFWKPLPPRLLETDEAAWHLFHAEALQTAVPYRRLDAWDFAQSAALLGAAGGWKWPGGPLEAHVRLALLPPPPGVKGPEPSPKRRAPDLSLICQRWYAEDQDDVPPALLYLAVRAARRALAVNPDDARAHLVLGESYLRLLRNTRERAWVRRVPELVQLRLAQASAALNWAVTLQPDLPRANDRLAEVYQELGYLDLMLHHLRAEQRLRDREARTDGGRESPSVLLSKLAAKVAEGEKVYAAEAARLRVQDRAELAFRHGLAGKARDLLLESNVAMFGAQGMKMELELQLRTGRVKEVREWTDPELKAALGPPTYHWLRIQALAASGNYVLAEAECEQLAGGARAAQSLPPQGVMALLIGQAVLNEQPVGVASPTLVWQALARIEFPNRVAVLAKNLRQRANANVFRGLLALEQGNVEEAEVAFQTALAVWGDRALAASGSGLDFKGRPIAQGYLAQLSVVSGQ